MPLFADKTALKIIDSVAILIGQASVGPVPRGIGVVSCSTHDDTT